jgi:hypothetical protein
VGPIVMWPLTCHYPSEPPVGFEPTTYALQGHQNRTSDLPESIDMALTCKFPIDAFRMLSTGI